MANKDIIIPPRERYGSCTGMASAAPTGTCAMSALRRCLTVKHGIDIGAGVIDEDYRGEIKVVLINYSTIPFQVRPGDRIAKLISKNILELILRK
jgi:dUTP pyrophosphatase